MMNDTKKEVTTVDTTGMAVSLTPEDIEKAKEYATTLATTNNPIAYGNDIQESLGTISQELLDGVSSKDMGDLGDSLRSLIFELKHPVEDDSKDKGFIQGFLSKLKRKTQASIFEVQGKYQDAGRQIDTVKYKLEEGIRKANEGNMNLDKQYIELMKYNHDIEVVIKGADIRLEELDTELEKLKKDSATSEQGKMQYNKVKDEKESLFKRRYNLVLSQQMISQQAPELLMIKQSNLQQIEQAQNTITTAIPVWKSNASMAVSLLKNKELGIVLDSAYDYTNEQVENTSKLIQESVTSSSERDAKGFVDPQKLIEGRERLSQTLKDVIKNNSEIENKMKTYENNLKNSEKKAKDNMVGLSLAPKIAIDDPDNK